MEETRVPQGICFTLRTLVEVRVLDNRISHLDGMLFVPHQKKGLRDRFIDDGATSRHQTLTCAMTRRARNALGARWV